MVTFAANTAMNHAYKGNVKIISLLLVTSVLIMLTFSAAGQVQPVRDSTLLITDTSISLERDTIPSGTSKNISDTIVYKTSANALDAPIDYHADDSMIIDVPGKKMLLYGKVSSVKYIDNTLTAPEIIYDQGSNLVTAILKKDSTGEIIYPTFTQADFKSQMDTIQFNPKTQKGITKGTYTQQGEMYVYGQKIKKVADDVFFAFRGRFTTCNLDTPHFAFVSKRIKLINRKMAYSGMVHPEFEGVPIPVYLPFAIYPLRQGRHSGLLPPSFTANEQLGLALENLGYYKVFSDNWDVVTRATFYSYGAWTANVNPRYYKRYKYQGNFSLNFQKFKTNFKGDPDYTSNRTFNVRWTHNADTKARPGVTFGASVDAGSSKFNENVPNSPMRNFQNQMQSSIRYGKVWKDKPYNIAVTANHNQNTATRTINLNLPDVNFNVNTLYPFRRKEIVGELKWYENLGIALNTNAKSLTSFIDTAGNIKKQMADNFQWGASHNVPITLSLPQIGFLQLAPTVGYSERWYQRKYRKTWNPVTQKLDTVTTDGFYTARDMRFGLNLGTRIFGMFTFGKASSVQAVRHEIRPSLSFSYQPNMNRRNFYETVTDTFGNIQKFSVFENSIHGSFSDRAFAGLNFSIDNNVSMKTRNRKDTAAELRKVSLLDGLSLSGSYNFLEDSFNLSFLSLNMRTNLLNKVNITASATLDPYQTNEQGRRIDKLIWAKRPWSLGTFQGGNISLASSFTGGSGGGAGPSDDRFVNNQYLDENGLMLNDYEQEALYMSNNPGEFADFSIPWSFDFSYSMRFTRSRNAENTKFRTSVNQDVNWNTSINLTPRWKLGVTGFYNITLKEVGMLSMYLSREMHCWQMAINISPVGRYRFFNITISPKSGLLRDLKVNRTRYFYDL